MKIKTYVVDHVSDVYPMIANDLGKDAFIIKTKPLRKSGFMGLFQKKQFEVVAAADDSRSQDNEAKDPHIEELQEQKRFEEMIDALVPQKNTAKTKERERTEQIVETLRKNTTSQKQKEHFLFIETPLKGDSLKKSHQQRVETIEPLESSDKTRIPEKSISSNMVDQPIETSEKERINEKSQDEMLEDQNIKATRGRPKKSRDDIVEEQTLEVPKKRGRPKKSIEPIAEEHTVEVPKKRGRPKKSQVKRVEESASSHQDSHQEVLKELTEVKGLIQAMVQGEHASHIIPKFMEKWVEQLRDNEVDEEVIQFIVKRVSMRHPNIAAITAQKIEQTLLEVIEQLFYEGTDKHNTSSQSFMALVGPTGVGKTTTIAKLAAAQVIGQRQKVGLLTTDTFRIAAVEQLKTYANILNVPFEVIDTAEDLVPAMHALKGCDIVFMDSAGRNYLEGEYVEEINQYLRLDIPQENYLVLSMTTRWRDMRKIVEQMKEVPIDKLILTKWDETSCYGVALNMVYHYPYPLSYLCLGQGVPQDIMKADPIYMAKMLLGVDDSETRPSTALKTII